MTPHAHNQHPHPWHPIHQRHTPHAIAMPRQSRQEHRSWPAPCACRRCRAGAWLAQFGQPGARMTLIIALGCYAAIALGVYALLMGGIQS